MADKKFFINCHIFYSNKTFVINKLDNFIH